MREITAGELCKILEEHERWIDDEKEGEKADLSEANLSGADLSGADLSGVIGFTINQLSKVKTLCEAELGLSQLRLMKQIRDKYPHLLKKPEEE